MVKKKTLSSGSIVTKTNKGRKLSTGKDFKNLFFPPKIVTSSHLSVFDPAQQLVKGSGTHSVIRALLSLKDRLANTE